MKYDATNFRNLAHAACDVDRETPEPSSLAIALFCAVDEAERLRGELFAQKVNYESVIRFEKKKAENG